MKEHFERLAAGVPRRCWERMGAFDWIMIGLSWTCFAIAAAGMHGYLTGAQEIVDGSTSIPAAVLMGLATRWMVQRFVERRKSSRDIVAFALSVGFLVMSP